VYCRYRRSESRRALRSNGIGNGLDIDTPILTMFCHAYRSIIVSASDREDGRSTVQKIQLGTPHLTGEVSGVLLQSQDSFRLFFNLIERRKCCSGRGR
jgi:hypothetical protein